MDKKIESLYELCETLMREIEECNEKIQSAGGELKGTDIEYIDKLTHGLKSLKSVIAMMEADDGYSTWYMPRYAYEGDGNRGGRSYRGSNSYARGRGRGAKRDSMGRYSREGGYSYAEEMDGIVEDIRGMMGDMPEEKRRKVERLVNELER